MSYDLVLDLGGSQTTVGAVFDDRFNIIESPTGSRSFLSTVIVEPPLLGSSAELLITRYLDRACWNFPFLIASVKDCFFPFVPDITEADFDISIELKSFLDQLLDYLSSENGSPPRSVFISLPKCLESTSSLFVNLFPQSLIRKDPIYCLSWSYLYKMNSRLTNQFEVILFLDIGYMCTDIGVVQMNNESANILLSKSSTSFRGQLLDQELLQLCVDKANQLFNQDVTQNKKTMFRLYQEIKKTRVNLSSCPEVELEIDSFIDGEDLEIDVDRRDFEARLEEHLLQLVKILTKVYQFLVKNSLKLSKVVLLGGFSYVPVIETTIKSHFDYLQSHLFERTLNAFEEIAIGGCISLACGKKMNSLTDFAKKLSVKYLVEHKDILSKEGQNCSNHQEKSSKQSPSKSYAKVANADESLESTNLYGPLSARNSAKQANFNSPIVDNRGKTTKNSLSSQTNTVSSYSVPKVNAISKSSQFSDLHNSKGIQNSVRLFPKSKQIG
ncbi:hypothetical protein GEMRC1_003589 [Eukaryota sp. GEM-RC1]